jgi:hypothetical protein
MTTTASQVLRIRPYLVLDDNNARATVPPPADVHGQASGDARRQPDDRRVEGEHGQVSHQGRHPS